MQDNAILLFLHLELLTELFLFHALSYVLKYITYKILRAITGLFFSKVFQSSISMKGFIYDTFCRSILISS